MKKLMQSVIAFSALSGSALLAQDITGTWQGTLQAGKELRTVVKISKDDAGALKALLYSIDQGGLGMPSSAVTVQGSTIKISIPGIGGACGKTERGRDLDRGHLDTGTESAVAEPEARHQRNGVGDTRSSGPVEANGSECGSGL